MVCLNFLLIKIGCDSDNKIKVDTSIMVSVMNSAEQSAVQNGSTSIAAINQINLTNGTGGTFNCGDGFVLSQTNNQTTRIINQFTTQQISNISTNIVSQVQSQLSQSQVQGILAFLNNLTQGTVKNEQDIVNKVKESVTNAVNQTDIASIWNQNTATNVLNIVNNGLIEGSSCKIIQQNLADVRVTNIVNTLQANLQNDTFLNSLLTYSQQTNSSGVFSLKWLIIAGIILGSLIIIGIVLYFIFGGKSKPTMPMEEYPHEILPEEREEIEECLVPARRRLEERGIPPTKEALRPDVERCLVEKRAEKREGIAHIERSERQRENSGSEGRSERFEGEGSRERFSEPRVAEETGRERFENQARYGVPNESVETLGPV